MTTGIFIQIDDIEEDVEDDIEDDIEDTSSIFKFSPITKKLII